MDEKRNISLCKIPNCGNQAFHKGFCRLHYLKEWKVVKKQEGESLEVNLDDFIEKLKIKYPKDFLDILKQATKNSENLNKRLKEIYNKKIEADEDFSMYDEDIEAILKNIKVED
ncbi:MAG: hypothetical protein ABIA04_09525 [Pseudomonadota bacterium]